MAMALNDAELVRQIGSGTDRQAEAELFRRMAPRVRLYGLRHMRDEHAAEDLTQQVLITTIEALRAGRQAAAHRKGERKLITNNETGTRIDEVAAGPPMTKTGAEQSQSNCAERQPKVGRTLS